MSKIMEYLPTVDEKTDFVSAKDLVEQGIRIKGTTKKKQIRSKEQSFQNMGWMFEQGQAGRYGQPAGFRRV